MSEKHTHTDRTTPPAGPKRVIAVVIAALAVIALATGIAFAAGAFDTGGTPGAGSSSQEGTAEASDGGSDGGGDDGSDEGGADGDTDQDAEPEKDGAVANTVSRTEQCPEATTSVTNASELEEALDGAAPGDVIVMEPGTYEGEFTAQAQGSKDEPIMLCGTEDAVLDGGPEDGGYTVHLDGAENWHLLGFSVTGGQKGVMADGVTGAVIEGLTVSETGDEAIHLRQHSTDNTVVGNHISNTGLRKPKFGEGVYIGSAESNWEDQTGGEPDASDRNLIENNHIEATSAEAVDIKEGTRGGVLRNNTFDGSETGGDDDADSWVDVKGNDWLIEGNEGTNNPGDGFQTHEILDGWGTGNTFRHNIADGAGSGHAIALTPELDNVVECNNSATDEGEAKVANVDCQD